MFRAVGRGNRWESPWWRCIWSFRIHTAPPCRTWLIKREGARLPISVPSHPVWQMQSPEKAAGLGCIHAACLLRRSLHIFFHCFFISIGNRAQILSAERWWPPEQIRAQLYSSDLRLTNSSMKTGAWLSCRAESLQNLSYWSQFDWHSLARQLLPLDQSKQNWCAQKLARWWHLKDITKKMVSLSWYMDYN